MPIIMASETSAGADPNITRPAGHVVELVDPVGQHHRVVVGQGGDAGAQADVLGALGGGGDEQLGAGDQLVAGRVVLADPGLLDSPGSSMCWTSSRSRWMARVGSRPPGGRAR